jgi:L-fuculose-phosphate aldolase
MTKAEKELRQAIIDKCLWMNASGLNQGTSGNISARYKNQMLITPSGIPYEQLKPEMITSMPLEGEYGSWEGPLKPSTEWRFHLDIIKSRPQGQWRCSHSLNLCDLRLRSQVGEYQPATT